MFIGRVQHSTTKGLDSDHVNGISGNFVEPAFAGNGPGTQSGTTEPIRCHVAEGIVPGFEIEVVGVGLIVVVLLGLHDVETGRLRQVERAQDEDVEDAKYHNIRANPESHQQRGGSK